MTNYNSNYSKSIKLNNTNNSTSKYLSNKSNADDLSSISASMKITKLNTQTNFNHNKTTQSHNNTELGNNSNYKRNPSNHNFNSSVKPVINSSTNINNTTNHFNKEIKSKLNSENNLSLSNLKSKNNVEMKQEINNSNNNNNKGSNVSVNTVNTGLNNFNYSSKPVNQRPISKKPTIHSTYTKSINNKTSNKQNEDIINISSISNKNDLNSINNNSFISSNTTKVKYNTNINNNNTSHTTNNKQITRSNTLSTTTTGNINTNYTHSVNNKINKQTKLSKHNYFKSNYPSVFNYLTKISAVKIQREFRNLIIRKYNPSDEMSNLLKKNKINLFKTYKSNIKNEMPNITNNHIIDKFSDNTNINIYDNKDIIDRVDKVKDSFKNYHSSNLKEFLDIKEKEKSCYKEKVNFNTNNNFSLFNQYNNIKSNCEDSSKDSKIRESLQEFEKLEDYINVSNKDNNNTSNNNINTNTNKKVLLQKESNTSSNNIAVSTIKQESLSNKNLFNYNSNIITANNKNNIYNFEDISEISCTNTDNKLDYSPKQLYKDIFTNKRDSVSNNNLNNQTNVNNALSQSNKQKDKPHSSVFKDEDLEISEIKNRIELQHDIINETYMINKYSSNNNNNIVNNISRDINRGDLKSPGFADNISNHEKDYMDNEIKEKRKDDKEECNELSNHFNTNTNNAKSLNSLKFETYRENFNNNINKEDKEDIPKKDEDNKEDDILNYINNTKSLLKNYNTNTNSNNNKNAYSTLDEELDYMHKTSSKVNMKENTINISNNNYLNDNSNIMNNLNRSKTNKEEEYDYLNLENNLSPYDKNEKSDKRETFNMNDEINKDSNIAAPNEKLFTKELKNKDYSDFKEKLKTYETKNINNNDINSNNIHNKETSLSSNIKDNLINLGKEASSIIRKEENDDKESLLKRINKIIEKEERNPGVINYDSNINQDNNYLSKLSESYLSNKNKFNNNDISNDNQDLTTKLYNNIINESQTTYSNNQNRENDLVSPYTINTNQNETSNYQLTNVNLELKETKKTIKTMKVLIEEQRREIKQNKEDFENTLKEKLHSQKTHYENQLSRQNNIIEGLINEKKKLITMSEDLTEKLEMIEKQYQRKITNLQENFDLETKRNKDAWYQTEKLRRKKWEDTKIKEIKEATVKGLEPEVERILHNHKNEIQKMEDMFNEDLKKSRDRLNSEYERRVKEMKDRFLIEKEEAVEHERKLASQRIRSQAERLEEEFNEERRRWSSNLQNESTRIDTLRENDKRLFEQQLKKLEERNNLLVEEKEQYYKTKIENLVKQNEDKLSLLEEDFRIKLEKEKNSLKEENMRVLDSKTKELKSDLTKDRDIQIRTVIEKLSEDTMQERKKIKYEAEKKAEEMNSLLKIENEQLKQKINDLTDKYGAEYKNRNLLDENLDDLSKKYTEILKENSKKEKQITELNLNYSNLSNKYSNIMNDFNKEKIEIENEYKISLSKKEEDLKYMKSEFEGKMSRVNQIQKEEIKELEERVTKILNQKEIRIKRLEEELRTKEIENTKYVEMIEEMRNDFLKR